MVQLKEQNEDFFAEIADCKRKLVLYGCGLAARLAYPYLPKISYVCDKMAAGNDNFFHGLKIMRPDELCTIKERLIILICIKNKQACSDAKRDLKALDIDAEVYDFYENASFNCYKEISVKTKRRKIKTVRMVCPDDSWILGKFADRMQAELEKKGICAEIGKEINPLADINHHIAFHMYEPVKDYRDTLMITHVDSLNKLERLKHQLTVARLGICMSKETMDNLVINGIPREKVCFVNPAQDGIIKPKKFVLGITHRNYDLVDNRKRMSALLDVCKQIDSEYFCFKIMGAGWEVIVNEMKELGFEVEYFSEFHYDSYLKLIQSLDYYLFFGFDEGSMGFLDALAAGVETIVTPQGYHLDVKEGITYPCRIMQDFIDVLLEIQSKKKRRVQSVENLNWKNYTNKHLEIWNYLLGNSGHIYENKHLYEDGIFSMLGINS